MNQPKAKIIRIGRFDKDPDGTEVFDGWEMDGGAQEDLGLLKYDDKALLTHIGGWALDELRAIAASGVIPGEKPPEPEKCPECGMNVRHLPNCSQMDLKSALLWMNHWDWMAGKLTEKLESAHQKSIMWEGKFRIVKHENNRLRKALEARKNLKPFTP